MWPEVDQAEGLEAAGDDLVAGVDLGGLFFAFALDAFEAAAQYAQLADAVIAALWPPVLAEFARKHGAPPGRGAVVLGMGSLGAQRLNAGSDLDLIVIYDADGVEESDGPRPLSARPYYARLTQALVTALSAPMAEGRLYEVDMRLRPSGRQGPVATALQSFRSYQRDEAWTWEHLALTRARAVAGSHELAAEVEEFRRALLAEKAEGAGIGADVAAMRARLQAAKPGQGALDTKDGPGRLQDIELFAQMGALRAASPGRRTEQQLLAARRAGLITPETEARLAAAYRLMWRVHCTLRLLGVRDSAPEGLGKSAAALMLREAGAEDLESLCAELDRCAAEAFGIIAGALPDPEKQAPAT